MTKAIGTAQVAGTVTLDREDTHRLPQRLAAVAPVFRHAVRVLPPCPPWCVDCAGGDLLDLGGGVAVPVDRVHTRTLTDLPVASADFNRDSERLDVRMFIERSDDEHGPTTDTRVVLELGRHDLPAPDEVDVDELTAGLSARTCRHIVAQVLAGV